MADAYDPTKETLQQWQQRQAMDAVAASQNQPNAIPNEVAQPAVPTQTAASRVGDYPQGQVIGSSPNGPSVAALNRPQSEFGTPAPKSDYQQRGLPVNEQNLHEMYSGQNDVPGINGVPGRPLNPQEQAFWAAHPNGAVKDPQTGNLIGLGSSDAYRQNVLQDVSPPATAQPQKPPDFVHIPEVNPALIAQRQQIQNEISTTQNQLRTASSQRFKGQPSQREILTQKLGTLTDASNGLGLEHFRQTEEQRKATDQNRTLQDNYSMHQDVMDATKAISQIKASHGSDEFKKQYFQITDQYPNALKDPAFKAEAIKTAQFHDERAAARQRAIAAGLIPQETGFGQKGLTEKYVDPNAVPTNVQTRYTRLQGNIQDHTEQAAAQQAVDTKAHKANNPYAKASQLHADQTEARLLTDKYPGLTGLVEKGNIDLGNRPKVTNANGTVSTEKSFSIGTDKGEVLIPQVVGGQMLSKEDAITHYKQTGEHLGIYKDIPSANAAADKIHNRDQSGTPTTAPSTDQNKPAQVRQNGRVFNLQSDGTYK